MLEGSTGSLNWRLFNHKKHLIVLTAYGFLARTIYLPFSWITYFIIVFSLIRDGIINGRRQIKRTDPNYLQVVQPIFLGIMIAVYLGLIARIFQGALAENGLDKVPQGSIVLYLFLLILACMALIFFPLIVAFMISFPYYIPYSIAYKFGKVYDANARSLRYDEMLEFLKEFNTAKSNRRLTISDKFNYTGLN